MKRKLLLLIVLGLLAGLGSLPLKAQEAVQTGPSKALRIGGGIGIAEINYLVGIADFSLKEDFNLWFSLGFAGYPSGEFPAIGMVLAFPVNITFFTDEITIFDQNILWGLGGIGFTFFYLRSPELPGITVSFANFSILLLQGRWGGRLENYQVFLKGGPFITLGPGVLGLLLELGLYLW